MPVVGPKLRRLLVCLLVAFVVLAVNSAYLAGVIVLEWVAGETYQDWFYQIMFLGHPALDLFVILPVIVCGGIHIANAHGRPNRRAVKAGYALLSTTLVLLTSGLVLSRGIPVVEVKNPALRELAYWLHVGAPLAVVWLFVLHRLAGPRLHWRVGAAITAFAAVAVVLVLPKIFGHLTKVNSLKFTEDSNS